MRRLPPGGAAHPRPGRGSTSGGPAGERHRVRTADIVCGLVLGAVALVVLGEGLRLGTGWGTDGPEPGFFVFYLGVALLVSALLAVVLAVRQRAEPRPFVTPAQLRSVATVFLPAAAMVVLTHFVGLYVSGALYVATYMRWIGRHSWPLIVLVAIGIPVATFLVFEVWFLVPLPKGPLEASLGY
jgi:putative tricarboxylic transport membrane protein